VVRNLVGAEEQTVSIDVLDMSDFDADDDDNGDVIHDDIGASPRPPSQPRPQTRIRCQHDDSPQRVAVLANRLHATARDNFVNVVCNNYSVQS